MSKPVTIPYTPRKVQQEIHDAIDNHRWSVIVAHRRLGKSVCAVNHLIRSAVKQTKLRPRYAYLAPQFNQAKTIAWDYLKHYTEPIPGVKRNESELWVELPNGARVRLFGADNPDSLRGQYLDGVVLDEVAQMKPETWAEVIQPALIDRQGWAVFIGTPLGINLFSELYYSGLRKDSWHCALYRADETGILSESDLQSARENMTESQYRREFLCCEKGSLIYTPTGQKPIENILPEDTVLSHSGRFRRVLKVFSRGYDGPMIDIRTYGDSALVSVTPEHPVQVLAPKTGQYKYVPAQDICKGDILVRPRRQPSKVKIVSQELVELIAWYICEGSSAKTAVNIALNANEADEANRICECCDFLGLSHSQLVTNSVNQIIIKSAPFSDFLSSVAGKMAYGKRVPWEIIAGYEEVFFNTLMQGDGCHSIYNNKKLTEIYTYVTVSRDLAYDVQMLSGMMGYIGGISRKAGGTEVIEGRTVNTREKYIVRINTKWKKGNKFKSRKTYPAASGVGVVVREVSCRQYSGTVHNLEVQYDNSYVVNGRVVHNCDFGASGDDIFISLDLARKAKDTKNDKSAYSWAPIVMGVDVARFGDDDSVIYVRQGLHSVMLKTYQGLDLMTFADRVADAVREHQPARTFIDSVGLGSGLVDRLRQMGFSPIEVNGGSVPGKQKYKNKRAECWGEMKAWLEAGGDLPDDPRLMADLTGLTYSFDVSDRLVLEKKSDARKRGIPSPDLADAVSLTFSYPAPLNERKSALSMAEKDWMTITGQDNFARAVNMEG